MRWHRRTLVAAAVVAVGVVAAPRGGSAQPSTASACGAWEIEYVLAGRLELSDTPFGQGDGAHPIGPGTVVLHFEDAGGQPGGHVKMVSYDMRQSFKVASKTIFGSISVSNEAETKAGPDACGAPEGTLTGSSIEWSRPVPGLHTEGSTTCDGSFCGRAGAPPPGSSGLHIAPHPAQFKPFTFGPDMKTFTMASMFVSKTDVPKQTAHLVLSGRETRRECVAAPSCK
jgi:hypothetical protein